MQNVTPLHMHLVQPPPCIGNIYCACTDNVDRFTAGVAVVATIPDTGRRGSQAGIQEEPQEADPTCKGLSLLEYMDLIAREETAEQDQNSTAEPWISSLFAPGADTSTKNESPGKCTQDEQDHTGNPLSSVTWSGP